MHHSYFVVLRDCVASKCLYQHQWSSGRIHRCHRCDPGSIPGWCILTCTFYVFSLQEGRLPELLLSRLCQDVLVAKINEAREIRTPNLLIWSQTRCRCAIAPWTWGQLTYNASIVKHNWQHSSSKILRSYLSLVTAWSIVTLPQQDKRTVTHIYIYVFFYTHRARIHKYDT